MKMMSIMKRKITHYLACITTAVTLTVGGVGCASQTGSTTSIDTAASTTAAAESSSIVPFDTTAEELSLETDIAADSTPLYLETEADTSGEETTGAEPIPEETTASPSAHEDRDYDNGTAIGLDSSYTYAENSVIHSGTATYYTATQNRKGITVCVNAGHGTSGGESKKTLCHPDGSPKVTSGTTSEGAVKAVAVSSGMEFKDGTEERKVTLALAMKLKSLLLDAGYDVLMIRESNDVQLDNVARTVIANNNADCHIALHWDSTTSDKGAFYMSVPNISSYRSMEPVSSHWKEHHALGNALIEGLRSEGVKIYQDGEMEMDLTQTSYSTIPSVDIELGDKVSDHSDDALETLAQGLLEGINNYFAV